MRMQPVSWTRWAPGSGGRTRVAADSSSSGDRERQRERERVGGETEKGITQENEEGGQLTVTVQ